MPLSDLDRSDVPAYRAGRAVAANSSRLLRESPSKTFTSRTARLLHSKHRALLLLVLQGEATVYLANALVRMSDSDTVGNVLPAALQLKYDPHTEV